MSKIYKIYIIAIVPILSFIMFKIQCFLGYYKDVKGVTFREWKNIDYRCNDFNCSCNKIYEIQNGG